jgi:GntR family transcriptional repressor for pyruvate dehydrogenase complex
MKRMRRLVLPKAYEAVHAALEDEILSGRLPPGGLLPTETELAEQFGVNRHTVREGIRVLEQSGFVQRTSGRRLHVTIPHHESLAPRTSRALLMQRVTFLELWEVALQLETAAADLAFRKDDPELLDKLEENLRLTELALEARESIVELDVAFHNLIAEATKNRVLLLAREPVTILFYPTLQRLFDHERTHDIAPRRLIQAHRRLVQGFRNRDGAMVHEWMSKHLVDFRRGYELAGIDLNDVAQTSY